MPASTTSSVFVALLAVDKLSRMKRRCKNKKVGRAFKAELKALRAFVGPLAEDFTDADLRELLRRIQPMKELLCDFRRTAKDKDGGLPSIRF